MKKKIVDYPVTLMRNDCVTVVQRKREVAYN